jgi:hypothetical protein
VINQDPRDFPSGVATAVNAGLTMLYWRIGNRVNGETLKGKRGAYGKQIVATLSRQSALPVLAPRLQGKEIGLRICYNFTSWVNRG